MPQASLFGSSWQGSLYDLANIVQQVRRMRAFGRLTLRNTERFSIAHLYFRAGKLAQVVGNRGDARAILDELCEWTQAFLHFDRGITMEDEILASEYELVLDQVLTYLHQQGSIVLPQLPKIIDSHIVAVVEGRQPVAAWEWQTLIEGTRRVSLAVTHIVGPEEKTKVLQDILAHFSSIFPVFVSLQIAPGGYLQVVDRSFLERMSREDILAGFAALLAICQSICSPIIGERPTRLFMMRALQEIGPVLARMGVFQVDSQLFAGYSSL